MANLTNAELQQESEQVDVIDSIEAEIAEFEKQTGEKLDADRPRNERGQFTRTTEAESSEEEGDDGARTAGEDDSEESAEGGKPPAETGREQQADKTKAGEQSKPAGQKQSSESQQQHNQQQPDKRSNWAKENERRDKSWKALNAEKEAWQKERAAKEEQFKLEREQFEAQRQQASLRPPVDAEGYSAAEYRKGAQDFRSKANTLAAQAIQAENQGDLDRADRLNAQSAKQLQLANEAEARAKRLEPVSATDVWGKLGQDMPAALEVNGPFYGKLREMIRADKTLLADPLGPYRAMMKIGLGEVKRLEADNEKLKGEAAKVPDLLKQIETLTAKVQELTAHTSLPGGDANLSRGASGEKSAEEMTLEELERWTSQDIAARA